MSHCEFIPACPTCGYDLRGTPNNRCPECGEPFNRAKVFDPEQQRARPCEAANYLLAAAILLSMIGWGFRQPYAEAKALTHVVVIWLLAFAWVVLRRHAIFGDRPWLVLWLIVVAAFAPRRPNLAPLLEHWVDGWSGLVAIAALAYAFIRRPIVSGKVVLYGAAVYLALGGVLFTLGPLVSVIFGLDGGAYQIYTLRFEAGGINDAIVAAIGTAKLIAAYTAYRVARRIGAWQSAQR